MYKIDLGTLIASMESLVSFLTISSLMYNFCFFWHYLTYIVIDLLYNGSFVLALQPKTSMSVFLFPSFSNLALHRFPVQICSSTFALIILSNIQFLKIKLQNIMQIIYVRDLFLLQFPTNLPECSFAFRIVKCRLQVR